jgi:nucleoside phosphorylase
MADSAAAISRILTKVESSLTRLGRSASASWLPKQWSLRTTELRWDLKALETELGRLPDAWQLGENPRQAISFRAALDKVEQSSRNVKTNLDNLQERHLLAEERSREFDAYATSSEDLRSAIRQFRETLLTLEEGAFADAIAVEHTEPDYVLEDQPWYAPLPPEFREIDHEEAEALRARIDAVLITATQVELLAVLKPMRPLPGRRKVLLVYWDNETYYLGRFGEYLVAITKCRMGSMGNGSAIIATIQAQHSWFPRVVIMIGIAFGKDRTEQRVADVIVASQVISYEPQRVGLEDVPRGPIPPTNDLLLNRFENAADWWFERPDESRCRLIVGPVLSGEKLIDNPKFKKDLFTKYPQAVGGEMEGAGLGAAAVRTNTAWILVKGICDWADGRKDSRHQPLAAAAATSLVLHILSRRTALRDIKKPIPPAG